MKSENKGKYIVVERLQGFRRGLRTTWWHEVSEPLGLDRARKLADDHPHRAFVCRADDLDSVLHDNGKEPGPLGDKDADR